MLELTKKIGETKGNKYISIENAQHINYFYEYTVSFTVFTSMLKLCRLLRHSDGLNKGLKILFSSFQFPESLQTDCSHH